METKGTARRQEAGDSLRGAVEVVPTPRTAPSFSANVAPVANVNNSVTAQIGRSLSAFASDQLTDLANKDNEKAALDGQMAYQQGKSMEDMEMGGNKWALQGYRLMQAQTISSSMLASQQTLIQQKGYQDDPDTFRSQYINQLDQQIDGLDASTARMVRETMTKQMPTLVSQHTAAHLQYQEEENFKALEFGLDTVSKDPTATDALLSMAQGGPGSASEGLSDDRRMKAVSQGVIRAFDNGNPQAYAKLKKAGVLDKLSTGDQQQLENAQSNYQNDMRKQFNAAFNAERQEALNTIRTGTLTGVQAEELMAKTYANHDMNITGLESNVAYVAAEDAIEYTKRGDAFLLEQAVAMGDTSAEQKIRARIKKNGGPRPATAEEQFNTIQEYAKEIEEQRDQEAEYGMRISQISIDEDLKQGHISPQEYMSRTEANRKEYGVKLSSAVTSRTVSAIEQARTAARAELKSAQDKSKGVRMEALDAQYEAIKATFDFEIGREGITPQQALDLNVQFENRVTELYSSNGVNLQEFNFSKVKAHGMSTMYTAMEAGMKYQSEEQVISRAAQTGTVDSLPVELKERYFETTSQAINKQISDEVSRGALDPEAADKVAEQGLLSTYVAAGVVDPQVRNESIAALTTPAFVKANGEINENVVNVISQYNELKKADPRVALSMLDDATRVRAEQVIEAAGGPNGRILDGVQRYHDISQLPGGFEDNRPQINDRTRSRIRKAVNRNIGRANVGIFQAVFTDATRDQISDRTSTERRILTSDETKASLSALVEQEVTRMNLLDPGGDPALMVKAAMQNVEGRVSFVGGFDQEDNSSVGGPSMVVMNQGKGLKEQMFGSQLSTFDKPAIENEVIVDYLQRLSNQEGFEFIGRHSTMGQLGSDFARKLGFDVDRPKLGSGDAVAIKERGVRPFMVMSDGSNVAVRIRKENGSLSEPISLDLPAIGQSYIKRYKTDLTE